MPGGKAALYYCGIVPTILLILGMIFFVYVPGLEFDFDFFCNVGFGLLVAFIVGEIIIRMTLKKSSPRRPDSLILKRLNRLLDGLA